MFQDSISARLETSETRVRAPDKMLRLNSIEATCVISSPNPMFDHLLESILTSCQS